jgi:hypothetical protein
MAGRLSSMGSAWARVAGGLLLAVAGLLHASVPASAQGAMCRQIEAELAALDRGATRGRAGQLLRQADGYRAEAARVSAQYQALGCGGFFLFNQGPPACRGLAARLGQLQAGARQLDAAADQAAGIGPGTEQRRRALMASLDHYRCRNAPGIDRTIRAGLLAPGGLRPPREIEIRPDQRLEAEPALDEEPLPLSRAPVSGTAVCVRTCDGYFFPLGRTGQSLRQDGDRLCQSLCPASETRVFFVPRGGEIQSAVSADGQAYSELPQALRYRRSFDPACGCKAPGQTWSEALQDAESLLVRPPQGEVERRLPPRQQLDPQPAPEAGAVEELRLAPEAAPPVRRGVRVIAPELAPGPGAAAAP